MDILDVTTNIVDYVAHSNRSIFRLPSNERTMTYTVAYQGHSFGGGGKMIAEGASHSRGIRGHAPPENFEI